MDVIWHNVESVAASWMEAWTTCMYTWQHTNESFLIHSQNVTCISINGEDLLQLENVTCHHPMSG